MFQQKTGCTRQSVSKLSLRSLALFLNKNRLRSAISEQAPIALAGTVFLIKGYNNA